MQRSIKFRAWYKKDRVFLDNLHPGGLNLAGDDISAYAPECDWMQFTGLQDRLGNDIYEGDILTYYKRQGVNDTEFESVTQRKVVEWKAINGLGVGFNVSPPRKHGNKEPQNNWEIIGNIYENPELVPKAKS